MSTLGALKISPKGIKPAMKFLLSCSTPAYAHNVSRMRLNEMAELMVSRKVPELNNVLGNSKYSDEGSSKMSFDTLFKQLTQVVKANGIAIYQSPAGSILPKDMDLKNLKSTDTGKMAAAGSKILAHLKEI